MTKPRLARSDIIWELESIIVSCRDAAEGAKKFPAPRAIKALRTLIAMSYSRLETIDTTCARYERGEN